MLLRTPRRVASIVRVGLPRLRQNVSGHLRRGGLRTSGGELSQKPFFSAIATAPSFRD
jgi:hypothetical protein